MITVREMCILIRALQEGLRTQAPAQISVATWGVKQLLETLKKNSVLAVVKINGTKYTVGISLFVSRIEQQNNQVVRWKKLCPRATNLLPTTIGIGTRDFDEPRRHDPRRSKQKKDR